QPHPLRSQSRAAPSLLLAVMISPSLTVALVAPRCHTSVNSASANFKITSRTLPRNASLNRSGPKRSSIWLKDCILFPIGVFLLGLTHCVSQFVFWDTERIRLFNFPQQANRRPTSSSGPWKIELVSLRD